MSALWGLPCWGMESPFHSYLLTKAYKWCHMAAGGLLISSRTEDHILSLTFIDKSNRLLIALGSKKSEEWNIYLCCITMRSTFVGSKKEKDSTGVCWWRRTVSESVRWECESVSQWVRWECEWVRRKMRYWDWVRWDCEWVRWEWVWRGENPSLWHLHSPDTVQSSEARSE